MWDNKRCRYECVTCKRYFARLLSIHMPLAGKCVGRVEAYIITALHYIAKKNAADALTSLWYVADAHRLSASKIISCRATIVIDVAVSGCCYYQCSRWWISTAVASSPSLPSDTRCHLDASIADAGVPRYLLHEVWILYSAMMVMLCGTRHRCPHCCETVMQVELESRRSWLIYQCLILQW